MDRRVIGGGMTLVAAVTVAGVVLTILVVLAPSCTDIVNEPRSVYCVGGLGEPAWKTSALFVVYLLLVAVSAVGIRRYLGE